MGVGGLLAKDHMYLEYHLGCILVAGITMQIYLPVSIVAKILPAVVKSVQTWWPVQLQCPIGHSGDTSWRIHEACRPGWLFPIDFLSWRLLFITFTDPFFRYIS